MPSQNDIENLPSATTTNRGVVELATLAETIAGTATGGAGGSTRLAVAAEFLPGAIGALSVGAPQDGTYVTLTANATLTNERVLTGTANQVTVTDGGAGSTVTLSTPQNIHTGATPTFAGLTLSSTPLPIASGGTGGTLASLAVDPVTAQNGTNGTNGGVGFVVTLV